MRLQRLAFAAAAVAGALLHAHAQSVTSASMQIGLVIRDTCKISQSIIVGTRPDLKPHISCALRHPFLVKRQDTLDQAGIPFGWDGCSSVLPLPMRK